MQYNIMLYNITQQNMRFDLCIDQWRWALLVHDPQLPQWAAKIIVYIIYLFFL